MSFVVGADLYDRFMGRYSVPLAPLFADFASVCAVDPSDPFVVAAASVTPT